MLPLAVIPIVVLVFAVLPIVVLRAYGRDPAMLACWPAMHAVRGRDTVHGEGPFRAAPVREERVEREIAAGVPWVITVLTGPALMQALMWALASVFAARELIVALWHGTIAWGLVSSMLFSLARATVGGAGELAAFHRSGRVFVPCVLATCVLDAALYAWHIPVSDSRTADQNMALLGLALHVPLAVVYAWTAWRRRGGVVVTPPALPPPSDLGPETYGEPEFDPDLDKVLRRSDIVDDED